MRFLADMGVARSTVVFLRAQGHDAVHLREQNLQSLDDEAIIAKARAESRIVLTHDLDFGRIVALSGAAHPSVITFRLDDMRPHTVNHYLGHVLTRFASELEKGLLVSVNEMGIRARELPLSAAQ